MDWSKTQLAPCNTHHLIGNQPLYARRFLTVQKFHAPGLAPVCDESGAYHITLDGRAIYPQRYRQAFGFYEDLATVADEAGYFHIDNTGTSCYTNRYAWCGNFQEQCCVVKDQTGRYFHIDKKGQRIYPEHYCYVGDFKDGHSVICKADGQHTHIDKQGKLLHSCWYLDLDVYHKGFARAKDERGWLHIDKTGQPIYSQRYASVEPFYNQLARVETLDGAFLTIAPNGEVIQQLRPAQTLGWQMLSSDMVGFWKTETLAAAVKLQLLDALPGTLTELMQRLNMPSQHLKRLLRALGELGIVHCIDNNWDCTEKGRYLTPSSDAFMASAATLWSDVNSAMWKQLPTLIQTGYDQHHPVFKQICTEPNKLRYYHQAIDGYAAHEFANLPKILNLANVSHLIGVGRSAKFLLEAILDQQPTIEVTLLGEAYIFTALELNQAIANRFKQCGCDLLQLWPIQAEAIILPKVLHYWPDAQALKILQQAKAALTSQQGKIYIVEMLLSEQSFAGGLLDLNMLVETGGKLRSQGQWHQLVEQAGLRMCQTTALSTLTTILEVMAT